MLIPSKASTPLATLLFPFYFWLLSELYSSIWRLRLFYPSQKKKKLSWILMGIFLFIDFLYLVRAVIFYGGFPDSSVGEECRRSRFHSWVRMICWRDRLPTPVFLGFPCGSAGKEFSCNMGYLSSIPRLGRSSGEGKGYPLQYSGLENSMDSIVHGVSKSHFYVSIPIQDMICLIFVQIVFQSFGKIL